MRAAAYLVALSAVLAPQGAPPPAPGGDDAALGMAIYKTHCASCHGLQGRGDGPLAGQLRFAPPDLTRISARRRGKFPQDELREIIDGRKPPKGHGSSDMPIWGDAFREASEGYSRERVEERIRQVIGYLESIQTK